jgi:N-methylhydantoinase B/oxoprolinase/acetone carboxylase alpha subunit
VTSMLDGGLGAADLAIADAVLASIAEEMGEALGRTAYSPNIKERRDYSCGVFDAEGQMVGQAAHMPVHLGAMPAAVRAVMTLAPFSPGDVYALNDPFLGGTHLPDVTTVAPASWRPERTMPTSAASRRARCPWHVSCCRRAS